MAVDWIKMRADLQTHPKVIRIASALQADRLRTIGGLHAAWCLFDAHSTDGRLDGYTPETLDELIGWPGFTKALAAVAWVEVGDGFLSLPRFDEHNGASAKRRANEAERKRRERAQAVPNLSASNADKMRTREEKRREESISTSDEVEKAPRVRSLSVADLIEQGVDEQVATEFLAIRKRKKAPLSALALEGIANEAKAADWTLDATLRECVARGWQGFKAEWVAKRSKAAEPVRMPKSFRELEEEAARRRYLEAAGKLQPEGGDVIDAEPTQTLLIGGEQ